MTKTVEIYVIGESESGAGIRCAVNAEGEDAFFLPKSQIKPHGTVKKNSVSKFDIPNWLYLKHWQLCGREAFEAEKQRAKEAGRV